MGVRLHFAKVYEVKYDLRGRFNYSHTNVEEFLENHELAMCEYNEDAQTFELSKEELGNFVEMFSLYENDERIVFDGYTYKDLYEFFKRAYLESPEQADFVHFAWF